MSLMNALSPQSEGEEMIFEIPHLTHPGVDLREHPAIQAWKTLHSSPDNLRGIQILKNKTKSQIYRLEGIGADGSSVIAKRCLKETALIEYAVYEHILPALPMPALSCYGTIEDCDPTFRWIFLEDAGGIPFNPLLGSHRHAFALWLGILHTYTTNTQMVSNIPERGCAYYLQVLHRVLEMIEDSLNTVILRTGEQYVLKKLLTRCEFVASCWKRIEERCAGISPTIVHGDLKEKNIRVRFTKEGAIVLPFDWEMAGRGEPFSDLTRCPDFNTYCSVAHLQWPGLTEHDLRQFAFVGWIFRTILAIQWKCLSLKFEFCEWPMEQLNHHEVKLAAILHTLGIS